MSGPHVFVDESKARDYLLVAAAVLPPDVRRARAIVRGLTPRGQRRVHMTKESDSRRRLVLSSLAELGPIVTIFQAEKQGRTEVHRRSLCLRALVSGLGAVSGTQLCIERDETLVTRDRQDIIEAIREAGSVDHCSAFPMLSRGRGRRVATGDVDARLSWAKWWSSSTDCPLKTRDPSATTIRMGLGSTFNCSAQVTR
jgi:hypothetical protein